jgi:hypothetical protein
MARVEEGPSTINIDGIIVSKNISDNKIIEILRNISMSKNKDFESQQKAITSASPFVKIKMFLNHFYDSDDYDFDEMHKRDKSSISLNDVVKCQNYDGV